jgi:hypothetical protein
METLIEIRNILLGHQVLVHNLTNDGIIRWKLLLEELPQSIATLRAKATYVQKHYPGSRRPRMNKPTKWLPACAPSPETR